MVFITPGWRPRRSVLFMPASNERALAKAPTLGCDGIILDLEDSVAPGDRDLARSNLARLKDTDFGNRERIVRITEWDSDTAQGDLEAALACSPDAILLPKLETVQPLTELRQRVGPQGPAIWTMVESPMALMNLRDLAASAAETGLEAFVVGPNDLAKSTGMKPGPDRAELLPWLAQIVAAARAHGLSVLDGVYNDFRNIEGLESECRQGARLGFDGKTLIHPAQIDASNAAFVPDEIERGRAQAIVDAYAAPENRDKGAIQINGEMVERLHLDSAKKLLQTLKDHGL